MRPYAYVYNIKTGHLFNVLCFIHAYQTPVSVERE